MMAQVLQLCKQILLQYAKVALPRLRGHKFLQAQNAITGKCVCAFLVSVL